MEKNIGGVEVHSYPEGLGEAHGRSAMAGEGTGKWAVAGEDRKVDCGR